MADRTIGEAVRLLIAGVGWDGLPDDRVSALADAATIQRGLRDAKRDPCRDPIPGDVVSGSYGYSTPRTYRKVTRREGRMIEWEVVTKRNKLPTGKTGRVTVASWKCWAGCRGRVVCRAGE